MNETEESAARLDCIDEVARHIALLLNTGHTMHPDQQRAILLCCLTNLINPTMVRAGMMPYETID